MTAFGRDAAAPVIADQCAGKHECLLEGILISLETQIGTAQSVRRIQIVETRSRELIPVAGLLPTIRHCASLALTRIRRNLWERQPM